MKWIGIVVVAACIGFPVFNAGPAAAQTRTRAKTAPPLKAEAFPTADDVERAYSNPAESLAALRILLDLLEFRAGTKTALAINRQNDYRRAIARLDPPRSADLQREADARKLKADPSFEFAIVARFLSADAPDAARKLAAANAATARQRTGSLFWNAIFMVLIAALLLPIIVIAVGSHVDDSPASPLPAGLARVRVLRKSYVLNYDGGRVTSYRDHYDRSRPGGGGFVSGGLTTYTTMSGDQGTLDGGGTMVTVPNRTTCTYETRDGRSDEREFGAHEFFTEKNAAVAFISCGFNALLCYEPAQDELVVTHEIQWLHRVHRLALWLASNTITIAGFVAIYYFVPAPLAAGARKISAGERRGARESPALSHYSAPSPGAGSGCPHSPRD